MPRLFSSPLSEFDLAALESDARFLVTCTRCYGVGQLHFAKPVDHWAACDVCKGLGKSAREPHVLVLVEEIRALRASNGGENPQKSESQND